MSFGSNEPDMVQIVAAEGGLKSLIDGVAVEFSQNTWAKADYTLPEALHVQELKLSWEGCKVGDYGFLNVVNPVNANGYVNLTQTVNSGDTDVDVGPYAPYFEAANGAMCVEFWDDNEDLIELRSINSVSGSVVTLGEPLIAAHDTTARLRVVLDTYVPFRDEAGYRFTPTGFDQFRSESELTKAVPVGMLLAARFKSTSEPGDRIITVNFRFRRPDV